MMRKNKFISLFLFLSIAFSYGSIFVPFNNQNLTYMGRVEKVENQYAKIYWPGTSVTLNFQGTELKAVLKNGKETTYFYAIVDGNDQEALKIKADTIQSSIVLATGLKNANHTVQLFKLSNNTSFTYFYGFELGDGSTVLAANPLPQRKIEFYGNSITAGHGVDVLPGHDDSGSPEYFNNYWTYAARTARHFNAQYSCISRSGIGVMVSWFPIIMPEMYDRLNPEDPASKWDFAAYTPDVVVINLFQNDMWLTASPNHPQFKARFGITPPDVPTIIQSYQNFVKSIRSKYPDASIICVLGSMNATQKGSPWPGYIETAVKGLSDSKILTHFFPYKDTPGHPKAAEQKVMADDLIDFIDKNITW
ncbi:MAG: GDSL-type esterase/lipase family protein [Paludibacter sp.]|nr:GDSL-type esterase/lipase family protein [Paludibacter sp.]